MPQNSHSSSGGQLNQTSSMSFAVAGCAFAAAAIGILVNHWLSGWMAVAGMAGVGLFYLAIGLLNLGTSDSIFLDEGEGAESSSRRASHANRDDGRVLNESGATVSRNEDLANTRL